MVATRIQAFDESRWGDLTRAAIVRYFSAELRDAARLPRDGGALLVGNHAMWGYDGVVLGTLVRDATRRYVRFLGDRNLWRMPVVGPTLTAFGALAGEPGAAERLLREGHLVGVYPGGVRDAFKVTPGERYVLKWGQRAGFAKVAMRAGVPIVPVAGLGIDEAYTVLGRERWIGRRLFGSESYDIPVWWGAYGSPLPRRVKLTFELLDPIDTRGDVGDPAAVEAVRHATEAALSARLTQFRIAGR